MPRLDREWRRNHVASGGCSNCKRAAVVGQSLCQPCRENSHASHNRTRQRLKAQGLCVQCRAPATHGVYCEPHAQQNRAHSGSYYYANLAVQRIKSRAYKHGITAEQVEALDARGACEICGDTRRLHIDHCHTSGAIRGLLCDHCNNMLGRAQDRPEILRRGAEYLERHR